MPTVYDFQPGRSLKGVNPQAAGNELERIRKEKGRLVAADVLEAAADPESPLHNAFEWNDSAAAQHHRIDQARRLIVSIRVVNSPVGKPTVAYVSVRTPDNGRSYLPTAEALTDEDIRVRLMAEVRTMIEALERRYYQFAAAADVLARLKTAAA